MVYKIKRHNIFKYIFLIFNAISYVSFNIRRIGIKKAGSWEPAFETEWRIVNAAVFV